MSGNAPVGVPPGVQGERRAGPGDGERGEPARPEVVHPPVPAGPEDAAGGTDLPEDAVTHTPAAPGRSADLTGEVEQGRRRGHTTVVELRRRGAQTGELAKTARDAGKPTGDPRGRRGGSRGTG